MQLLFFHVLNLTDKHTKIACESRKPLFGYFRYALI